MNINPFIASNNCWTPWTVRLNCQVAEWDRLPGLVTQLLGSSQAPGGIAELEAALQTLVCASVPWLEQRLITARFKVDRKNRGKKLGPTDTPPSSADALQASNILQSQKWRVTFLLIQAWNLLNAAVEPDGTAQLAPLEKFDLAEIAHALRMAGDSELRRGSCLKNGGG